MTGELMGERAPLLGERTKRWIIRRAPFVLLVTAGIFVASLSQIVDLRTGQPLLLLDPSVDGMLPSEDEGRAFYEDIKQLFSAGEVVLVALVADDIFTFDNLTRLQTIGEEIEQLDQVDRVTSLSLSLNIRSEDGALVTEPFYDSVPSAPDELADLRSRALSDPIYAGNLVSKDGRVALVVVHLLDIPEQEILASGIDDRVREIASASWRDGEFWMSGGIHVRAEMSRLMLRDSTHVVPISALVMALIAFVAFRTLRGVAIPVLTVAISALATMAFVAMAYGSLNQLTVAVPSVMIVVGFAYSIHIVSAYYDAVRELRGPGATQMSPALMALHEVAAPTLFTGLTTAAGFGSLATSSLASIQQYGIATSVGVVITMIVTLTFSPALLALLPVPASVRQPRTADRIDQSLAKLARFDIRNRVPILIAGGVVALLSAVGLSQIVVGSDLVGSFNPNNPVRKDFNHINDHLEGANSLNIVLTTSVIDGFKLPQNLHTLDALQDWLAEQPDIGGSTSFADYIKAIHKGIQDGDPDYYTIPDSKDLVSQLLVIGANEELDEYVDADFQTVNISVRTTAMDSIDVNSLVRRIDARLGELPHHIQGSATGNTVLISRTMDDIAIGQAKSLGTAFIIIYLILVMLFTSFKAGLIALIPNALPVLVYFGILGWSGVQLNASTGLIACIILGIAVDDTIHLLTHFNRAAKAHADEDRGVVEALRRVGKPVTFTTVALCLGFLCLALSEMQPQVEFAYLAAVTLLAAWLVDMTFTPALAARMQIVTIWDVLTLDLGDDPQRSIPLFSGLSTTQARITALLAQIVEFPEGYQVLKHGAEGHMMYVVIDGELKASVYRGDREVLLRTHSRGDVVGEVALFHGTRTADVTATTDVRLLRITQNDFESIQRRHPRIGAQLYANLNKVLADRMAELTTRADR
ncbi:MAG: MMPL family transporter [Deltaproteobacteria bacterium]|nr:MMPL family transporter [Deltaproteobacteria bacterium]